MPLPRSCLIPTRATQRQHRVALRSHRSSAESTMGKGEDGKEEIIGDAVLKSETIALVVRL